MKSIVLHMVLSLLQLVMCLVAALQSCPVLLDGTGYIFYPFNHIYNSAEESANFFFFSSAA